MTAFMKLWENVWNINLKKYQNEKNNLCSYSFVFYNNTDGLYL